MSKYDEYYIYTFKGVIVRIVPYKNDYVPITLYKCNTVRYHNIEEIEPFKYSYQLLDLPNFQKVEIDPSDMRIYKDAFIAIRIMERFNSAKRIILNSGLKNITNDGEFYNRLLLNEIDQYERNGSIGLLLDNEMKRMNFTIQAMVDFMKLTYEDMKHKLIYIKNMEVELTNLIYDDKIGIAHEKVTELTRKLKF